VVPRLKPGTKLLRERQGRTHEILVGENGFVWAIATVSLAVTDRPGDCHKLVGGGLLRAEAAVHGSPRLDAA
jgi:hypothetical protein